MYKPLPEGLTIKDSPVHGLGLHASKELVKGIDLGITHVYDENYEKNEELLVQYRLYSV